MRRAAKALKAGSKDLLHDDENQRLNEKHNQEEEKKRESEKLLQQRFKTFDFHFKDIVNLLDAWDRTQGNIYRQPSPSEKSEHEDPIAAKNKKQPVKNAPKDKDKKEKADVEKPNKAEQAAEVAETVNWNIIFQKTRFRVYNLISIESDG